MSKPLSYLDAADIARLGYNLYNDPRMGNLRGAAARGFSSLYNSSKKRTYGKNYFSKCRKTTWRKTNVSSQRSIKAPLSRVQESKNYDVVAAFSGLKSTAPFVLFNFTTVATGTSNGTRVGNNVRLMQILLSIEIKEGDPDVNSTYRVLIVKCKNGVLPAASTDLLNADANGAITPCSLRNVDNIKDFDILLDNSFRVSDVPSVGGANVVKQYKINTCIAQKYNANTAASIVDNPLVLYILSSAPFGTTGATGQYNIRTLYTDA